MDRLDEVLDGSARPTAIGAGETAVELARSVADLQDRGSRRRWVVAAAVLGSLVLSGGAVSAAAQAGWVTLPWVDGADKTTVYTVTLPNGHVYECPYAIHVQGDFTVGASYAKIQDAVAEAKRYLQSTDLQSIAPDTDSGQDPQTQPGQSAELAKVQSLRWGWFFGVTEAVHKHLAAEGLPDVGYGGVMGACERVSS